MSHSESSKSGASKPCGAASGEVSKWKSQSLPSDAEASQGQLPPTAGAKLARAGRRLTPKLSIVSQGRVSMMVFPVMADDADRR